MSEVPGPTAKTGQHVQGQRIKHITAQHNTYSSDTPLDTKHNDGINSGVKRTLHIYAKNARLGNKERIAQLLAELSGISWDAILFSETRAASNTCVVDGGHKLYTNLGSNFAAGVGILIHRRHCGPDAKHRIHRISDRVMALDLSMYETTYRIAAVYVPHAGYSQGELDTCYDQLDIAVQGGTRANRINIVGGDFNSQRDVGTRGDSLRSFVSKNALRIANLHFTKRWDQTWTFKSSTGILRQIDFILVSRMLPLINSQAVFSIDLGSDHRAVMAKIDGGKTKHKRWTMPSVSRRWSPKVDAHNNPTEYCNILNEKLQDISQLTGKELEHIIVNTAEGCKTDVKSHRSSKPWLSERVKILIRERRATRNSNERKSLSKSIQREIRSGLRRFYTEETINILSQFQDLGRIDQAMEQPIKKKIVEDKVPPDTFADVFEEIYKSSAPPHQVQREMISQIPVFTIDEFMEALKHMKNGKCADSEGVVVEMIKHGSDLLHQTILSMFNEMLRTGVFDNSWSETVFRMLPKSGDLTKPGNWRPIAKLKILYKIFSRIIYQRLQPVLVRHQPWDQMGYMPGRGTDDAFFVAECLFSKTSEWNLPVWIASLDLRKAFDRIEFQHLFEALRVQGIPECYIALLAALYSDQTGSVNGSRSFKIMRGVKQGDVLSAILFSAGLEHAMGHWKTRLVDEGFLVKHGHERLTNIRYADDIIIYAKSQNELMHMLVILAEELARIGLNMNIDKTKILSTATNRQGENSADYIDIGSDLVEVLAVDECHKYLGRKLCLSQTLRAHADVGNRLGLAWAKFRANQHILCNKHVPVKLRLKFFNSTISPTALFGSSSLSIGTELRGLYGRTERKMMRSIVGWVRLNDESWETTMSRMKRRVEAASQQFPVPSWEEQVSLQQWKLAWRIGNMNADAWPLILAEWDPYTIRDDTFFGATLAETRQA